MENDNYVPLRTVVSTVHYFSKLCRYSYVFFANNWDRTRDRKICDTYCFDFLTVFGTIFAHGWKEGWKDGRMEERKENKN